MPANATDQQDPSFSVVTTRAGGRLSLLVESFARLTGKRLIAGTTDLASALWRVPRVIVAHGIEQDPIFFYGNRLALELFEADAQQFVTMPSRLSAEPLLREARAVLLARVARDGYIDDYEGVRISTSGRRFRIERATVWTLIDGNGRRHGQAATFDRWQPLD